MRTFTLALLLIGPTFTQAQWPTYPDAPLVVCDAANIQSGVRAMSDGADGWLVLWTDKRNSTTNVEIYGQRFDHDGYPLWTANGKSLVSIPGENVFEMAAAMASNGNLLIAYLHQPASYQDTLNVMAYDMNGDPVWDVPTEITRSGSSILGQNNLSMIATEDHAFVGWYDVYVGGSNQVNVTRIDLNGGLPWGMDGLAIPNASYGPFLLRPDQAGGVIVNWRCGNGAGACSRAQRVSAAGNTVWGNNFEVSAGGGGLAYAFDTQLDGTGSLISVWTQVGADIAMARWDTTGAFVWTPSPFYACNESHAQDNPVMVMNEGELFVAWGDNRPPANNQDLYVQKFDMNGAPQWTADGVAAIQTNTYIPTPGIVASDEGAVIATFNTTSIGFCARRVLNDGSLDWPAPTAFCTTSFNPFYEDQVKLADGDGGVVAFWSNNNNVYGAHILRNGALGDHSSVEETSAVSDALRLFPSPTEGPMTVLVDKDAVIRSVRVLDAHGRAIAMPTKRGIDRLQVDVSALSNGMYTLELTTADDVRSARFVLSR